MKLLEDSMDEPTMDFSYEQQKIDDYLTDLLWIPIYDIVEPAHLGHAGLGLVMGKQSVRVEVSI